MDIKLEFKLEKYFGPPCVQIMIDDTISSYEGPCEEIIELTIPMTKGMHELRITHYGKKHEDHMYDADGNLVCDKHVEISEIHLDGVALKEELWNGEFFPVYDPDYVRDMRMKKIDLPHSIRPNLYLGHNGTWVYYFRYPVVQWLIEKKNIRHSMIINPDFTSAEEELMAAEKYFNDAPELHWQTGPRHSA